MAITEQLITKITSGGMDFLKYGANHPNDDVQLKDRNEVGSIFLSLVNITAGLERNKIRPRPARNKKNLVNANGVSIVPMFFQRMSRGSEALCTCIIMFGS